MNWPLWLQRMGSDWTDSEIVLSHSLSLSLSNDSLSKSLWVHQNRAILCGCGGEIFTAPPQDRAIFSAPRCVMSLRSKIASERRFSLWLKRAKLLPIAGIPAIPESAVKIASALRCAISVHSALSLSLYVKRFSLSGSSSLFYSRLSLSLSLWHSPRLGSLGDSNGRILLPNRPNLRTFFTDDKSFESESRRALCRHRWKDWYKQHNVEVSWEVLEEPPSFIARADGDLAFCRGRFQLSLCP